MEFNTVDQDRPAACSIIMPCYNAQPYIGKSIDSVLGQTFSDWELIIVDDGSTDDSVRYIKDKYCSKDNRIHLICLHENQGPAVARNTAIEHAKGRFVAFLDSDDQWLPSKLDIQIDFMLTNNYAFTHTSYRRVREDGYELKPSIAPKTLTYKKLLKSNVIGCFTAIYDTKILGYNLMPMILKRQDYGLWLKLLKKTEFAYGIQKELGVYCVREHSVSSNKFLAARYNWKLYRDIEKLGLLRSFYYFLNYAFIGILKK